jgi:catechol 2,3-dioxygenase-like lactoylglutathione lyase family enzyme
MNIKGIAWIGIVSDQPAMRDFYQQTLNLKVLDESEKYAYYAVDAQVRLEILASHSKTAAQQSASAPAIGFLVDDIEAAYTELLANGTPICSEIKAWQSEDATELHRWFYFEDPDGNTLLMLARHDETSGT